MDITLKEKLKKKYIEIINGFGYKLMYDLDKDLKDEIHDLHVLVYRIDNNTLVCRKKYVFLKIPYSSPLSLSEFEKYLPGGNNEKEYNKFVNGVRNRMVEFNIDDVIAMLLYEGYHLEDVYQFIQGKPRLKLNPEIIERLIEVANMKGSPIK